ncbi:MAG: threonine dehydratase, partial [Solirubrobacteraceae bacterium]
MSRPSGTPQPADVVATAERQAPVVRRTAQEGSYRLSAAARCEVWLKREDTQLCRSYKVRGAYALIASLSE